MDTSLLRQRLLFFGVDISGILAAFLLAFYLRLGTFGRTDFPFGFYFENALLILPLWLFFLVWGGKYALNERRYGELFRIVSLSALAGSMLFVLIFFFRREIFFSRLIVFYIFLFGSFFGMLSFFLEQQFEKWKVHHGKNILRVLIIGANRAAEDIIFRLQRAHSRYIPVAILAPFGSSAKEILGVPVLGKLDALERIVEKERIREIFLCDGAEQMLNLLSFAEGRFLGFRVSPQILGVFRENIFPETLAGKTILALRSSPLLGWGQFFKRVFDTFSALIILTILSPVWFVKKLLHPLRPIFSSEERIGAGGRQFRLFRFSARSKFFRDLPNIFNILRGEMSFVGPRPALPEEWEQLPSHFRRRMILKPGLFGKWQLQKLRGKKDDFELMCQEDISYLQNWSFAGDMGIILRSKWELMRQVFGKK